MIPVPAAVKARFCLVIGIAKYGGGVNSTAARRRCERPFIRRQDHIADLMHLAFAVSAVMLGFLEKLVSTAQKADLKAKA
jgi:hypothetical protein